MRRMAARGRWLRGMMLIVALLTLVACSGPGPLPPTYTPVPPTPTPRPTATTVPTNTATPRPTPPPTPLPGTKAATPIGTQNIPLPTAVPGSPSPPMPMPKAATATPAKPLGPAYRIAFVSGRNGSDDIFIVDPNGDRLTNLTHSQKMGGKDSDPQWSPDGTQIAFVSDRDGNADIWVMNADGSGAKNLTRANAGDDLTPRWSPDSTRIAYVSFRNNDADIYVMNRDGGNPQDMTKSDSDDLQPAWSPDGTQVVFVSARNNKPRAVYTVKVADPGNATVVVSPPCNARDPAWSPDGKTIAVVACAGADGKSPMNADIGSVYTVPATGGSLTAVTDGKADSGSPVWSPDSGTLAFWSYRNAQQADVVLLALASSARQTIMAPPGAARDISWAADGANLAFVAGDFNAGQIVIAAASGGNPRPLLSAAANDRQPRWSPMPIP